MARIDWVVLCDMAFLDKQDRMCIVGIVRKLPTPSLPLAISQMMLVAHLTDIRPVEELEISVGVLTPSGRLSTAYSPECMVIEMAHEYILVTLRDLPLKEEGIYRFQVALKDQPIASLDVRVVALDRSVPVLH